MTEVVPRPKKRLFIVLIILSLLVACISTYAVWMVSSAGLASISRYLPTILGTILVVTLVAVASGIIGVIFAILGFATPSVFQGLAWSAINLLFPLAIRIGKLIDLDKERVERSFIEVSNHLIRSKNVKVKPEKLLILTPHCIQQDSCPYKITRDVNNCKACGNCQVGELLKLSQTLGFHFAVVTGGTLARKVIKTLRPHAVLAIACERDLTSGIQDVYPLPVIGVINERPFGPCCNTKVDMHNVESVIKEFLR
ncbi:DUF116 domain-containing protein [Dendrosporobacter sp. 1207_IL3150]|uniref:DUF116 domain-containing protein n=1 Tax=Dendrosporobacter sp. 1207_IL3150 TaxID=3084054 RepID=UPI002FD9A1FA